MPQTDRQNWDARYRERGGRLGEPSPFVMSLGDLLPRRGRALDVAGGTGRNALWLAQRGLDTTVADISTVGLDMARTEATARSLRLSTLELDLETEPLPAGPWDLILCIDFLWRPLFEQLPGALAPGGLLVVAHPTRSNLLRHDHPGLRYLLEDGELPGLVQGLEIVHFAEGWHEGGRHEARLIARHSAGLVPEGRG